MQKNFSIKDSAKREGQIIKRGKTYLVRIYLYQDEAGKKIYYNATIKGTRKDAEEHIIEYLHKKYSGKLKQLPSEKRLKDFVEDFFVNIANTRRRNREIDFSKAKLHIFPYLGHFKLRDISTLHIETLYKELRQKNNERTGKPLSGTSRKHIHAILCNIFGYAYKRKLILENPLLGIIPPKTDTKEINTFSPEEAKRFLDAIDNHRSKFKNELSERIGCMFHLALETGLRPEEYFALQWKDIDFGDLERNILPTLQVRRVSIRMQNKNEWWFDEPKTTKSKRSIPISNELVQRLKKQKANIEKWKSQAVNWKDYNLVFPNNLGESHYPDSIRRIFKKYLEAADIDTKRYSPYSLRHSCATLLLRANIHPKIVSERLGHSSITITLDIYSHCLPTMQETATQSLTRMIYSKPIDEIHLSTVIDLTANTATS